MSKRGAERPHFAHAVDLNNCTAESVLHRLFKEIGFPTPVQITDQQVDPARFDGRPHYFPDELPVFFGHYWLPHEPILQRENICCLDYSVAKGGKLVAYRFDGEVDLNEDKLRSVDRMTHA
jgi:hypothetical protein